jgi:hypothetical protein
MTCLLIKFNKYVQCQYKHEWQIKVQKLHIFHCFNRFCLVIFIRICVLHTALILFGCISPDESHSMYNEWLCPYPDYGVYRHFQNLFGDMVVFCFIIKSFKMLRNRQKWKKLRNYGGNKYLRFGKLRGPYLFTSYQFAKFKDQINMSRLYNFVTLGKYG